jgi:hypothetical protein
MPGPIKRSVVREVIEASTGGDGNLLIMAVGRQFVHHSISEVPQSGTLPFG